MQPVVFEHVSKLLLFFHLVAGVICIATSVHLLLRGIRAYKHPGSFAGQVKIHAFLLTCAYLFSVVLGGLIYPAFRVQVRYTLLDAALPWATGLFEMKELLATVGILPVLGILAFSRALDTRDPAHRSYYPLYIGLVGFVLFTVTFNACCGWYLGTIRSL